MKPPKILVLLLAGGEGNRLGPLTCDRAKPVLPFAGQYCLLDFPLSNCVHSGLNDVWVVEQFQAHSINDHLRNGRPWDLDRTYGGLQVLPPIQGTPESGWHQGNADALWRNRRPIRAFDPDLVLVLSADAVYRLDYRDVVAVHLEQGAEVTIVTTLLPVEEAKRFGVVRSLKNRRVKEFAYKSDDPPAQEGRCEVACEVFVYDARVLLEVLDELAARDGEATEDAALEDFGHELLPELVSRGQAYSHPLEGYWRDVGTIDAYFDAHMEFLSETPPFQLDAKDWPILSHFAAGQPARFGAKAQVGEALVSPGCQVNGSVQRSVLSPDVIVEAGANVTDSILLPGACVQSGVRVRRAIVEAGMKVTSDVDGGEGVEVVAAEN